MLIALNKNEGCTVVLNHTDNTKTHSVVISRMEHINGEEEDRLYIREFNSPTSDNSDYEGDKLPKSCSECHYKKLVGNVDSLFDDIKKDLKEQDFA